MALIDVPTLARRLANADPPTVIDVRWRLGGPPGRDGYVAGHIPGASFLDLDRELCGPPGDGGRHPLPDPAALEKALRTAGVRAGHQVVAYDAGDGQAAARLWWTLRWAGHDEVAVLDGGFAAWVEAGRPIEPGIATAPRGDIEVRPGGMPVLDADSAAALAADGVLLDARAYQRYRGEVEPVDPVAGHIPGAVNLPAASLVDGAGLLRAPANLRAIFADAGVSDIAVGDAGAGTGTVGAYCGSGVTAAQTVLALHLAGYDRPALYVGSWSNWCHDRMRPIALGDTA